MTHEIETLELNGRLDINTSKQFQEALDRVAARGAKRVIVDCGGLEYVSSSGLRIFILGGKRFASDNGGMTICGLSSMIRKTFDVTGLSSLLTIVATREEAVTR